MPDDEEQSNQPTEETSNSQPAPKAGSGSPIKKIVMVGGLMLLFFFFSMGALGAATSGLGLFANAKNREQSKSITGAGSTTCTSWSEAPAGLQTVLESAAGKVQKDGKSIQPALLGAIALSEHSNSWSDIRSLVSTKNGRLYDGETNGGQGLFQIESWAQYWGYVRGGHFSDKTTLETSPFYVDDSALAIAASFAEAFNKYNIPYDTAEEKYIVYAGMYHNRGEGPATAWAEGKEWLTDKKEVGKVVVNTPFDLDKPPANSNAGWEWGASNSAGIGFSKRAWASFQDLNVGCTSVNIATGAGRQKIAQLAIDEIGVSEPEAFTKYAGGRHENWCADFVSYIFKKVVPNFRSTAMSRDMPRSFAQTGGQWFNAGEIDEANLHVGDVYVLAGHVGIIVALDGKGGFRAVEGNAGGGRVKWEPSEHSYYSSFEDLSNTQNDKTFLGIGRWNGGM